MFTSRTNLQSPKSEFSVKIKIKIIMEASTRKQMKILFSERHHASINQAKLE